MTNEDEAYEWYLDRLSMPPNPVPLSKEECEAYNKEHALPAKEELDRILKDAGVLQLLATSQKDWWYFYTQKGRKSMIYLIEYRGEVMSGKTPDLHKNELRCGERLHLF